MRGRLSLAAVTQHRVSEVHLHCGRCWHRSHSGRSNTPGPRSVGPRLPLGAPESKPWVSTDAGPRVRPERGPCGDTGGDRAGTGDGFSLQNRAEGPAGRLGELSAETALILCCVALPLSQRDLLVLSLESDDWPSWPFLFEVADSLPPPRPGGRASLLPGSRRLVPSRATALGKPASRGGKGSREQVPRTRHRLCGAAGR